MEAILFSTVLPALMDLVKNGLGAVTRKFVGVSVDDQIKMDNAQILKLQALAQMDNPNGEPSQWVVDLRAAYRYVAATAVIIIGAAILFVASLGENDNLFNIGSNLVGMPFGFIFGERLYLGLKGQYSK